MMVKIIIDAASLITSLAPWCLTHWWLLLVVAYTFTAARWDGIATRFMVCVIVWINLLGLRVRTKLAEWFGPDCSISVYTSAVNSEDSFVHWILKMMSHQPPLYGMEVYQVMVLEEVKPIWTRSIIWSNNRFIRCLNNLVYPIVIYPAICLIPIGRCIWGKGMEFPHQYHLMIDICTVGMLLLLIDAQSTLDLDLAMRINEMGCRRSQEWMDDGTDVALFILIELNRINE